jgi:hypothetical protein
MRKKEFKKEIEKPVTINDSRFGIRKVYLNTTEVPSIFVYPTKGKGANGESSN